MEQQIEKETFKEEIEKSKIVNLDNAKPEEKELIESTELSTKEETTAEAPKIQKKKKTRCTKCKINVGCIGKLILFYVI